MEQESEADRVRLMLDHLVQQSGVHLPNELSP